MMINNHRVIIGVYGNNNFKTGYLSFSSNTRKKKRRLMIGRRNHTTNNHVDNSWCYHSAGVIVNR